MKISQFLQLTKLLQSISNSKMGLTSAYSIAKFLSSTSSGLAFFNSRLSSFLTNYVLIGEDGAPVYSDGNPVIDQSKKEQYQKEMHDIENFEVEIPQLQLYYDDLPKDGLSPNDLILLMPYIIKKD